MDYINLDVWFKKKDVKLNHSLTFNSYGDWVSVDFGWDYGLTPILSQAISNKLMAVIHHAWFSKQVSQMWASLAARREPVGVQNRPPNMLFLNIKYNVF